MSATLAPSSAPTQLAAFLEEARVAVDAELDRRLRVVPAARSESEPLHSWGDDPGRLAEAMHYAATGPGKRLRPALVIAACEACGGTRAQAMPAAAAIEMLHAYTLVHDDLPAMDDDDERRGRPTVHIAFGEAIAILAGDGLLTAAFGALAELGPRAGDAVAVLARRAGVHELLGGQAIDLTTARETLHDLGAIERMHAAKTGALFAAAAELGAISAGADNHTRNALARFGMAIGIAFQHADDRDDAELTEHAERAAERMRVLCGEARQAVQPLGSTLLDSLASWIAARA
ncbi:MAG TPA: polyprenyl synthetase family protein [Kofleriaceae bacterium]|nr:polyprenyl synthetase family protein [Kofleriaceae bacterium]